MTDAPVGSRNDWVGSARGFALAWGLPIAVLVAAIWTEPPAKTWIWTVALVWMGAACLMNARRCGRTHCYFTGPFFLTMAVVVLLHGYQIAWLGAAGWRWIGISIAVGGVGLWCLTEQIWGKFSSPGKRT